MDKMKNQKPTLLQQAQAISHNRASKWGVIDDDKIEVALAWLEGKVSYIQITKALDIGEGSNIYNFLSVTLREAYRKGMLRKASKHAVK